MALWKNTIRALFVGAKVIWPNTRLAAFHNDLFKVAIIREKGRRGGGGHDFEKLPTSSFFPGQEADLIKTSLEKQTDN